MKIRMLDGIGGMFHGQYGVKRGDIVDVDEFNGKRYIANGLATAKLTGDMAAPYEPTEESVALRDEVLQTVAAQCHNPEFDPRPGSQPIGRRYAHNFNRQGWLGV